MGQTLHFGVTLPQIKRTWAEARAAAIEFEALGFDSVWVCDHLHGIPQAETPILEALTELTAVAAVTERLGLGSLVTPPGFRNPAVLAKQLATIDHIAGGGRVIAGLGAGWNEAEYKGYGLDFPPLRNRMDELEHTCETLRQYWANDGVFCEPRPDPPPKILIGGSGEQRLMGIAARHADIWNNLATTQGELGAKVQKLRQRCEEVGRDPAEITVSQQCTVVIAETEADAADSLARANRIFGGHLGDGLERHGIWGTPAGVIERIEQHVTLGCTMFVIEFFGRDTRVPARLFAETVLPAVRV